MTLVPLNSPDGTLLAARVYEPLGPAQASIAIGGAMGALQSFYFEFAEWLAAQGCLVTKYARSLWVQPGVESADGAAVLMR